MTYLPITGTFIDEITHDIGSQNWGAGEWETEFDTFVAAGIDTVIVMRTVYGKRLACPSKDDLPLDGDLAPRRNPVGSGPRSSAATRAWSTTAPSRTDPPIRGACRP